MSDLTNVTKFFPKGKEGFVSALTSGIASGAGTVPIDNLTPYANGTVVVLVIDPGNSSKQVFTGTVNLSSSQVEGVHWTEGSNTIHNSGAVIVDYVTATHYDMLAAGMLVEHNDNGSYKYHYNVKAYGALGDGTTDDYTAIQAAITAAQATGGVVFFPAGTYIVGTGLTVTASNVQLVGVGVATSLKAKNAANLTTLLTISGTGVRQVQVKNMQLDGNKANTGASDGINLSTPWATTDAHHVFEDLRITSFSSNGFKVPANSDTRIVYFNRVHVIACDGNGFYFLWPSITDSFFNECIAETCALNGFYLGLNTCYMTNCYAFWNGSGGNYHGFYITSYSVFLTGCVSQDNYKSGFYVDNSNSNHSNGVMFVNCSADSNGQSASATYSSGFQLVDVTNVSIIGGAAFTRDQPPAWTQKWGVKLTGTSTGVTVTSLTMYSNSTANWVDSSSGTNFFRLNMDSSKVNQIGLNANTTGSYPSIQPTGTDANIGLYIAPKGSGQIFITDSFFNEILRGGSNASAVNDVTISNAATGFGPSVAASGDDTNIDLNLQGKGTGSVKTIGKLTAMSATATPAGGTAGAGYVLGSASVGLFWGSGVPTLSAAQGSLYMRTDGSSTSTRLYVNTNGTTGWTNVTTAT